MNYLDNPYYVTRGWLYKAKHRGRIFRLVKAFSFPLKFTTILFMVLRKPHLSFSIFKKIFRLKINFLLALLLMVGLFILGTSLDQITAPARVIKTPLNQTQSIEDITVKLIEAHSADNIKLAQQAAPAPKDKKFIVLFTEVENASSSGKSLVYSNMFRLEEQGKKIAPLPVNGTFVVPPKATVDKQLVFLVDKNINDFKIWVGDINKEQKSFDLNIAK